LPLSTGTNEIALNEWAARDLGAKVGDKITIKYFVMGPRRQLEEKQADFRLRSIVPLSGAALDPALMPDFPGIAGAENCRDWEPGMSVNLDRIRPQDEKYWDAYKGTPKAFLIQRIAANLWENRWGEITAVRYPLSADQTKMEAKILQSARPDALGLHFMAVRTDALAAGSQGFDFGGLFIAFSFFLIVAALLLTALLFALNAENRAREIGTLLALGFTPKVVRRLLLTEGLIVSFLGALPGAFLGLLYTRAVLNGLNSVWQGATATAELQFHAAPASFIGGIVGAVVMALFSIWLVARKQGTMPARVLLGGGIADASHLSAGKSRFATAGRFLFPIAFVAALGLVIIGSLQPSQSQAGLFFGAGFLLLFALCGWGYSWLSQAPQALATTAKTVALRNLRRRAGRSLAVIILLSCASFLIASVGAFRQDPQNDQTLQRRDSGTGGFALWAESALPVYQDLNSKQAREKFALEKVEAGFVPLRVRAGDDASCLNLNRAQTPQLWGVNPQELQKRKAFGFDWTLLEKPQDNVVPAIGDENTIMWGLGKGVGSTLDYVDENGKAFRVQIVGLVKKTILQGALIINEKDFIRHFPSAGGYRNFLIDVAPARITASSEELTQGLQDFGFEVTPAPRRLALFQNVENTYLSIFQALGGLGLLLGSAGLGVVVLRNVLERRSELALLRAVGWEQGKLQNLIFIEHAALGLTGLGIGVAAGLLSIIPSLKSAQAPSGLMLTLLVIALSALFWTYIATKFALRGALLEALRNE
jgi:ABC-type antimicrobial peptide transport system permease subunit